MGPRAIKVAFAALLLATAISANTALAAGAANNHTVLILASTVAGGLASPCAQAVIALGYDVELATPAEWLTKSTEDFASYRALILGDPHSETGRGSTAPIAAAEASVAVWGPAIDGNVMIIGSDPANHLQWITNSDAILRNGIGYVLDAALSAETTGFLFVTSWYYNGRGTGNVVAVLSFFGRFVANENTYCHDAIHITQPTHPAMAGLTDASLSRWNCSIHALFVEWPSNFAPVAIADGLNTVYAALDGSGGTPYVLFRADCSEPSTGAVPDTLWSPNHKMIDIVIDNAELVGIANLTRTVTCSETPNRPWTVYYEDGVDLFHFKLRADRNGGGPGRVYTITYTGTDVCGNTVATSTTVIVPHDQSSKNDLK